MSQRLNKFGRNGAVGIVAETIWATGGRYAFPTTAEVLSVVSGDAVDTALGTGLRTVRLQGLDENWDECEATVTLNGAGAVVTTQKFLRLHRIQGLTAGSGGVNAGVISVTNSPTGTTLGTIQIGLGQSQLGFFSIARNGSLEIQKLFVSGFATIAAADIYELHLMVRQKDAAWNLKSTIGSHIDFPAKREFDPGLVITGPADIELVATASKNSIAIAAEFDAIMHIQ